MKSCSGDEALSWRDWVAGKKFTRGHGPLAFDLQREELQGVSAGSDGQAFT